MPTQNCVKVSYRDLKQYIICATNSGYEDFIDLVCERFKIRKQHKNAILLTNGHSYVFNKDLFEYYILLFPNPQIIFHVRLDFSKICIFHEHPTSTEEHQPLERQVRLNKKRSYAEIVEDDSETPQRPVMHYIKRDPYNSKVTDEAIYPASPVRRQNCFLGALPRNTAEATVDHLQQQRTEILQQSAKRRRLMPLPISVKKSPGKSSVKRSIII